MFIGFGLAGCNSDVDEQWQHQVCHSSRWAGPCHLSIPNRSKFIQIYLATLRTTAGEAELFKSKGHVSWRSWLLQGGFLSKWLHEIFDRARQDNIHCQFAGQKDWISKSCWRLQWYGQLNVEAICKVKTNHDFGGFKTGLVQCSVPSWIFLEWWWADDWSLFHRGRIDQWPSDSRGYTNNPVSGDMWDVTRRDPPKRENGQLDNAKVLHLPATRLATYITIP